jgi:hypothetical protein
MLSKNPFTYLFVIIKKPLSNIREIYLPVGLMLSMMISMMISLPPKLFL